MKIIKKLMCGLLFTLLPMYATSQTLRGKLVDEQNNPLPFVNVVLQQLPDTSFISGCISNADGVFELSNISDNQIIRISSIGYSTLVLAAQPIDMGSIQLTAATEELGEVVVKGNLAITRIKNDALVTTIQNSPLEHAGTANDVLGRIPGVIRNGKSIEVLGKGAPLIYINGRQVRNVSELDQLSSNSIKDIEVITTPGAQYDASVNSVIRIKTVKPVGEGFSFNNRTLLGIKYYLYGLEEVNFNYRKNGFDLFGMLEYDNQRERQNNTMFQNTYSHELIQQSTTSKRFSQSQLYAAKLGMNYTFNERHSLGFFYDFSFRPNNIHNNSTTTLSLDSILQNELTTVDTVEQAVFQHLVSGYYNGNWGKWQLDINADFLWNNQAKQQHVNEVATQTENRMFITENQVGSRLYATKAVVSHPLWQGKLSFGTEWSFIRREDIYTSSEMFIMDSNTKLHEDNGAGFIELSQKFGKVSAMVGLRYEHVDSRYYEDGKKMDEQSRIYDNLFPSAMLSFPINNVRMRLNYTRKITRPAFSQLNGNVQYINRYTYQSGNPYLRPSYRDYVSLLGNYRWLTCMIELCLCI